MPSPREQLLAASRQTTTERPVNVTAPLIAHRLSRESYEQIRAKLPNPIPPADCTPQHVGYLLGIQAALRVFEETVVTG